MKLEPDWIMADVLRYCEQVAPYIGEDDEGQMVLYTGLWFTPDGGLTDEDLGDEGR